MKLLLILVSVVGVCFSQDVLPPSTNIAEDFFTSTNWETINSIDYITLEEFEYSMHFDYDINNDKNITNAEFHKSVHKLEPGLLPLAECLWEEYDLNKDLLVNKDDFIQMIYQMDIDGNDKEATKDEFVTYFSQMVDRAVSNHSNGRC